MGPKHETLEGLKNWCKKTQWSEHIEKVLEVATIQNGDPTVRTNEPRVMTPEHFPYVIKDSILPQCNTGFVCMLISLRMKKNYIGTTKSIRSIQRTGQT